MKALKKSLSRRKADMNYVGQLSHLVSNVSSKKTMRKLQVAEQVVVSTLDKN
jgi:hypothetical protein